MGHEPGEMPKNQQEITARILKELSRILSLYLTQGIQRLELGLYKTTRSHIYLRLSIETSESPSLRSNYILGLRNLPYIKGQNKNKSLPCKI